MAIDIDIVTSYTRYNSGTRFMDSGGECGRHWQQPVTDDDLTLVKLDDDGDPTISLTALLRDHATIQAKIQTALDKALDDDPRASVFDVTTDVMEALGYVSVTRNNTYYFDSDLNQDFVYEVFVPIGDDTDDYFYNDDAIVVINVHTGADIRGGYAPPLAVKFDGDLYMPVLSCQVWCSEEGADYVDHVSDLDVAAVDKENLTVTDTSGYVYNVDYYVE